MRRSRDVCAFALRSALMLTILDLARCRARIDLRCPAFARMAWHTGPHLAAQLSRHRTRSRVRRSAGHA